MFIFGHLGFGLSLTKGIERSLPKSRPIRWNLFWVSFGTLLPDLIDKPVFYFFRWWSQQQAQPLGLISGTRTFGHTLLLYVGLFFLFNIPAKKRGWSFALFAVLIGVATHLFLDHVGDYVLEGGLMDDISLHRAGDLSSPRMGGIPQLSLKEGALELLAEAEKESLPQVPFLADLLWPLRGTQFPLYPFTGAGQHVSKFLHWPRLIEEGLGLLLLLVIFFRFRREFAPQLKMNRSGDQHSH